MNICVCVKQVPDTETKIKLNADGTGIDAAGIKWMMSPYDEFAVEEALRLRDKNAGSTVTVYSAGPERVKDTIVAALAMGCDNGVRVDLPDNADSFMVAKALAGALAKDKFDIIFTGKEAIDDGAAQVSQLLAEKLKIGAVTVVLNAEYKDKTVRCKREVEGGTLEIIDVQLPAVIAAQKGLNEPRYASLPNIMKAKKKPINTIAMGDVGVSAADQKVRIKKLELPPQKQAGKKLSGSAEEMAKILVKALREEAKVV